MGIQAHQPENTIHGDGSHLIRKAYIFLTKRGKKRCNEEKYIESNVQRKKVLVQFGKSHRKEKRNKPQERIPVQNSLHVFITSLSHPQQLGFARTGLVVLLFIIVVATSMAVVSGTKGFLRHFPDHDRPVAIEE